MILFAVLIIFVFGGVALVQKSNSQTEQANILYPFSGYLSPSSNISQQGKWTVNSSRSNVGVGQQPEDGLFLVGMAGGEKDSVPQMQCPSGYRINVVGAYLDIADPYGECSSTPTSTVKLSCGNTSDKSGAISCKVGGTDCGPGMECPAGKCVPKTCKISTDCASSSASGTVTACPPNLGKTGCSSNNDCGDPTLVCVYAPGTKTGTCQLDPGAAGTCMACVDSNGKPGPGTCAVFPTCANTIGGENTFCSPSRGDSYKCRPRDASAYLAKHCDGKSVCLGSGTDAWNPNELGGIFGPLPCQIPAYSASNAYASLPISTGWAGGSPQSSASGNNAPATFHQGYYVHGLYSCVPEDANVLPL